MRKTRMRNWAWRALRLSLGLLAGLALLTTPVAAGPPAATFSAAVNYTVGSNPHGVAAGVFSKSGHMDLAVANQNDNTVTVLLGDGKGGFAPAPGSPFSIAPASAPIAIAVGHFTSSGNLDIVTANQSGSVTVFPGKGDGTFNAAITSSTGSILPNAMAVGDLRGIGRLDVVVTDQSTPSVGILLGNGDGTFQAPTTLALDSYPSAVVLADLRNSGKLDLAVATGGSGFTGNVDIFLGNGDGTFTAASPATVAVGPAPLALAAGNFNGKMDLVVANSNNTVSVLLRNGSGGFTAASPVTVGSQPSAIAVGDFNLDGKLDFVTANNGGTDVSLALGNGDGTFQPATSFAADQGPIALAVGDFNGDGKPDLAVANQNPSLAAGSPYDVSILLNTTPAGPPPPPPPPPPPSNTPPTANADPPQTVGCAGPSGAMVKLVGSGSDPDGDTLSFTWLDEHGNLLPGVSVVNNVATVTVLVPPGTHTFTLQVNDGHGSVATASTTVDVIQDTTPPSLSVALSPTVLWPPNNKLVPIHATFPVLSDVCDPHPSVVLVRIWSNDPDEDKYDIKGASWGTDDHSFLLRARKADGGRQRIYTVVYRAMDAAGNMAFSHATVVVPHSEPNHDRGKDPNLGKGKRLTNRLSNRADE